MKSIGLSVAAISILAALTACSGESRSVAQSAPAVPACQCDTNTAFSTTTSIKELMDSIVDPAADNVWAAVASTISKKGIEEKQPRTDEEWLAVRREDITLIEATNLLLLQGRHAAPEGSQPGMGELAPLQIDERIAQSRPAFNQLVLGLRRTAQQALVAIDQHDASALLTVGGDIDAACEACHLTYWYPPPTASSH